MFGFVFLAACGGDGGSDTPAFRLASSAPADGAGDVSRTGTITLNFSEEIDPATASADVVTLNTFAGSQPVTVAVSGTQLIITPATELLPRTIYTVNVGAGLRSRGATPLSGLATARFTTNGAWGSPTFIGNDETLSIRFPKIAPIGDTGAIAVWSESDGSRSRIMANRYTPTGGWSVAEEIGALDGSAHSPKVIADATGNAIAIWIQNANSTSNVAANVLTAGVGWGVAEPIGDGAYAGELRLAISANGRALALWRGLQDEYLPGLWARQYVFGSGWDAAELINNPAHWCANEFGGDLPGECLTQVAMDADGGAVAVWRAGNDINANRFIPGEGWGSEERLSSDSVPATDPRLATDAAGNYLATWREVETSEVKVWSASHTSSGGWGDARELTDSNNRCNRDPLHGFGSACTPFFAMNARGDAVAVWHERVPNNTLWARRHTAGTGWLAAEAIGQETNGSTPYDVGVDPAGNAIMLSMGGDMTNGYQLRSRRYTAGSNWGTSEPVGAPVVGTFYFSPMSIDALGNAMVIHASGLSYRFE